MHTITHWINGLSAGQTFGAAGICVALALLAVIAAGILDVRRTAAFNRELREDHPDAPQAGDWTAYGAPGTAPHWDGEPQ